MIAFALRTRRLDPERDAVRGTVAMDRLVEAGIRRALPLYRNAIAGILEELRSVPSLEAAFYRLTPHASPLTGLGDLLHRVLVTSELAGRATFFEQARRQARFAEGDLPEGFDFDPLPAEEALRFFRSKVPVSDSAFRALTADMRALAFRIAGVEDAGLIAAVRDKLDEALQGQLTLGQFLRDAPTLFEAYGVTPTSRHHLETVFRTNTLTALNAGKWEEAHDPELAEFFPLYRYSAILDDRTRPEHAAMHHFTAPINDPVWETWFPPNGYNCRCTVVPLSEVYVERHHVRASRASHPARTGQMQPDEGFRTNPKAALEAWSLRS